MCVSHSYVGYSPSYGHYVFHTVFVLGEELSTKVLLAIGCGTRTVEVWVKLLLARLACPVRVLI